MALESDRPQLISGRRIKAMQDAQKAAFNILEDLKDETDRLIGTQRAILNILEDLGDEKSELIKMQRAMLNILEDFEAEKNKVESMNLTLRKKSEELDISNRELERFAYIASHDLREPLRMISRYLQLIAMRYKGRLDKDADEFIDFAVDGAVRMDGMIVDLLEYSRVQTMARPFESVDSGELLRRTLDDLGVLIGESGAEVACAALPVVTADPYQLTRVFQNLIGNAIKFRSPDASPKVRVSCEDRGSEWLFSVSDNGIGIEAKDLERIFFIFERVHGRRYPGTGLGLAIARKIVERHGGRMWAVSEPGKGSTFFFVLPKKV